MRKLVITTLFFVWLAAIALALLGTTKAFGIGWWIRADALVLIRIWILVSIYLVATGYMFESVMPKHFGFWLLPWLGWLVYSTTIDGKSMTNFFFIDGPIVMLLCYGIFPCLALDDKKRRLALPAVFLAEVVGVVLVIRYIPGVGD